MKRFWAMFLMLAVLISTNGNALAIATIVDENETQEILNALSTLLPHACNLPEGKNVQYSLGNKLKAYKLEAGELTSIEYDMYPVFANNVVVAIAQVAQNQSGEQIISCLTAFATMLQEYYEENPQQELALIFAKEGTYVVSASAAPVCISTVENEGLSSIDSVENRNNGYSRDALSPAHSFSVSSTPKSRSTQFMIMNLDYVSNETSTCTNSKCTGRGLCWAASAAMVAKYYTGITYTAKEVHDLTGCYSNATVLEHISVLRALGVYASGAYYSLSYSTIQANTQADMLMYTRIERTTEEGTNAGHIIVVNGYYYVPDSTTRIYYFMDPNSGLVTAIYPTSGEFTVATSGRTYTFDFYLRASSI